MNILHLKWGYWPMCALVHLHCDGFKWVEVELALAMEKEENRHYNVTVHSKG